MLSFPVFVSQNPPLAAAVFSSCPVSPFVATLTELSQPTENKATLSLVFAALTSRVKHKSCLCHSYKKTPGWGVHLSIQNGLTPFVRLCLRVCPFASFSYNARPFTREVNR